MGANRIMERLIGSRNGVMILLKDDDNFGKGGPWGSLEREKGSVMQDLRSFPHA